MTKTLPPGVVELEHATFQANVLPDVFDDRDLDYRPRLQPLPATVDARPDRHVLEQVGNSCTGHAVAAMINAVLASQGDPVHVSPYMLYRLARRYDEFPGEEDEGSSLRSALKGWFYHGVLPEEEWSSLDPTREPDIDHDTRLLDLALRRPLGAFYRVNATRLDDMQSAVNELSGVVASAAVHEGWIQPQRVARDGASMHVIDRTLSARPLGGHAFTIVGYNEVGFLVQNSWGKQWGHEGFATLPYDDWLESAYDAWVARPGVHSIVSPRNRAKVVSLDSTVATAPGPDLDRLTGHVVNLGNEGRLSNNGRFVSSPLQVHQVFERMEEYHRFWREHPVDGQQDGVCRLVLYAHGGLNSERTGLTIAHKQLNWWLNNRVFPVTFAWQSGASESLLNHLTDLVRPNRPAGGIGFNLVEQFDRLVEGLARSNLRWMWTEMKENAARASDPIGVGAGVTWPPRSEQERRAMGALPGASLVVSRLRQYVDEQSADGQSVEVHLVGHSAGSIFLGAMLVRLAEAGVPVQTLTFLAPAIRTDRWLTDVLPHLRTGQVKQFASFGLNRQRELDDVCGAGRVDVYHKSLLYLVSRALESTIQGRAEVPLVGMEHQADISVDGATLAQAAAGVSGDLVWAPSEAPAGSRTDARTHGGFDDDAPTMTSVLHRILRARPPSDLATFVPYMPLHGPQPPERAHARVVSRVASGVITEDVPAGSAGAAPRARVAAAASVLPGSSEPTLAESSPVMDSLLRKGWQQDGSPETR